MLLRSITKHVKEQNWFAVLLDFLIVVIGILIAFQITNWNEARQERALEIKYLERFFFDMERSIAEINDDLNWIADRIHSQKVVLEALRAKKLNNADKSDFDRGLAFFGYVPQPNRNWQTIEELKSTGSMSILKDEDLRELILSYESSYNAAIQRNTYNRVERQENRMRIQDRWRFIDTDLNAYGETKLSYDFNALADDKEFLNRLSHMQLITKLLIRDQEDDLANFTLLRDATVKSLGYTPIKKPNTYDWKYE